MRKTDGIYYVAHYLIEKYQQGDYLDEQKVLTSYIDNDTFLFRQNSIKTFLEFEESKPKYLKDISDEHNTSYGRK